MVSGKIHEPIFLIGVGRSGSSLLLNLLAQHPHTAWLSGLCDRYPDKPVYNKWLLQAVDVPIIGDLIKQSFQPWENYLFWEFLFPGFRRPFRDLEAEDVTLKNKEMIRSTLARMLTKNRRRLLIKITGWPRIGFLDTIFPDAKFIHLIRDGRAVANSLINVPFWRGWEGTHNWRWGKLSDAHNKEWKKHNLSFIALAAIEWKMILQAVEKGQKKIEEKRFMEVRYEDLCAEPVETMKKIARFANLTWSQLFEQAISKKKFMSANSKWQAELSSTQQKILQEILSYELKTHGYH